MNHDRADGFVVMTTTRLLSLGAGECMSKGQELIITGCKDS